MLMYRKVLNSCGSPQSCSVGIQMKATEGYFPVVLFITLCRVILLSLWVKSLSATFQIKAFEEYFSVLPFVMLYKVIPSDDILKREHSLKRFEQYFSKEQCAACFVAFCKIIFRLFFPFHNWLLL